MIFLIIKVWLFYWLQIYRFFFWVSCFLFLAKLASEKSHSHVDFVYYSIISQPTRVPQAGHFSLTLNLTRVRVYLLWNRSPCFYKMHKTVKHIYRRRSSCVTQTFHLMIKFTELPPTSAPRLNHQMKLSIEFMPSWFFFLFFFCPLSQ